MRWADFPIASPGSLVKSSRDMQWAGDDSCGCRLCGDGGSRNLCRRARLCGDLVVWRAGRAACRRVGSASTGAAESNTANCICTFRRNGAGWSGGVAKPSRGCASPAGLRLLRPPRSLPPRSRRRPLPRRCSLRSRSLLGKPHLRPACRVPRTLRRLTGRSKSLRPQPHRRTRRRLRHPRGGLHRQRRSHLPRCRSRTGLKPLLDRSSRPHNRPRNPRSPNQRPRRAPPKGRWLRSRRCRPRLRVRRPRPPRPPRSLPPRPRRRPLPRRCSLGKPHLRPACREPRTLRRLTARSKSLRPRRLRRTRSAARHALTRAGLHRQRRSHRPRCRSRTGLKPLLDRSSHPHNRPRNPTWPNHRPRHAPPKGQWLRSRRCRLRLRHSAAACDEKHGISSRSCSGPEGSHCAAAVAPG